MKKCLRVIAVLLIIAMMVPSVFAAEQEEMQPYASSFFTSTLTYLYDVDQDTFGVWFEVQGKYPMDVLGASSIKIQRSATGTLGWVTMKTYYPSSYSQLLDYDTIYHGDLVTYNGTPGYYYRACVTFYAEKDGNIGEYISYTAKMQL